MSEKITVIGPGIIDVAAGPVSEELFAHNSTPVQNIRISYGGNGLNEAVALGKLGASVELISKVGADDAGKRVLSKLKENHVCTDHVLVEDGLSTGINIVLFDAQGERRFLTNPQGSLRKLKAEDLEGFYDSMGRIVSYSSMFVYPLIGIPQMEHIFQKIKDDPERILLVDMTMAKKGETIDAMKNLWRYVDYLVPNTKELEKISHCEEKEAAEKLLDYGCRCVIVKKGAEGATVWKKDERYDVPSFHAESVVDTTGAGDSFAAGFMYGLFHGMEERECVRFGACVASFCVQCASATDGIPDLDIIMDRYSRQ